MCCWGLNSRRGQTPNHFFFYIQLRQNHWKCTFKSGFLFSTFFLKTLFLGQSKNNFLWSAPFRPKTTPGSPNCCNLLLIWAEHCSTNISKKKHKTLDQYSSPPGVFFTLYITEKRKIKCSTVGSVFAVMLIVCDSHLLYRCSETQGCCLSPWTGFPGPVAHLGACRLGVGCQLGH